MCAIRFLINLLNIPLWFIRAFTSQCQTQPFSRNKTEFHLLKQRTYFCHTFCNHFTNYKIYIWNMSCVCSAVFISSKNAIDIQGLPSEKPKFLRNVLFAQKIAYFSYVRPNDIGQCRQFDCCSSDILLQKSTKCQIVNSKKD